MYAWSEDELSNTVLSRVLHAAGVDTQRWRFATTRGAGSMRREIAKYANLARRCPVVLFTDLDTSPCPAALIAAWAGNVELPDDLLIRVAVRSVESWLLADQAGCGRFLGVSPNRVPRVPDTEPNAKQALLRLAAAGRNRRRRQAIVANRGTLVRQALEYNSELSAFVLEEWDLSSAASNSPSLSRTVARLKKALSNSIESQDT